MRFKHVVEFGVVAPRSASEWLAATNRLACDVDGVALSRSARVLPGRMGPGDAVWDVWVDHVPVDGGALDQLWATMADRLGSARGLATERMRLATVASGAVRTEGAVVLRTLLIRVRPGTSPQRVAAMEAALVAMPRHIAAIRSWTLSRVGPSETTRGWTHVWEQEFDDASGFGPYMSHPFHWTAVERWFDPEIPGHIVDLEEHYMTEVPQSVLGAGGDG